MSGKGRPKGQGQGAKPRRGSKSQPPDDPSEENAAWICESCKGIFTKEDSKLLVCDYCDLYFCIACAKVSDVQYSLMAEIPGTCWYCTTCLKKARECIKSERLIEERCAEYCKKLEVRLKNVEESLADKVSKDDVKEVIKTELAASSDTRVQVDLKKVTMAINEHQKYLESLEAKKRAQNIIITGVPENAMVVNGVTLTSDNEKCAAVLQVVGEDSPVIKSLSRLGKERANPEDGHPRFIKIELENSECRNRVLRKSKNLKEAGPSFSKIYMKKDTHPMVNREFQRLKKVTREEKEKPENQGRSVSYDPERRQVLVDDVVVDEFRPTFF